MDRRASALLIVLAVLVSMTACLTFGGCSWSTKKRKLKIGVIVSLSGLAAPLGEPEQRSINLLKKQLERDHGINGTSVEFVIEDDESDPAKAGAAVSRLIAQEKVSAIIGGSSTGSTLAIASVSTNAMVPVVAMAAGTKITQPVRNYIFSVAPGDALVIKKALLYFQNELKVKKIAILHDSNAYGTGGADQVKAQAPQYGISIAANESYGSADTDMIAQLTKITRTDAQAILVWGTNPGPASIAKNMRQLGIDLPFVGSSGIANKNFIELAGAASEGVIFPVSRLLLPSTIPSGKWKNAVGKFSGLYKNVYGKEIDPFAAHGWDASNIVVNAMKVAGGDRAKIRDEIEKLKNYAGVDGVFTYSPTDHAGLDLKALVMVKIQNGQWVEVRQQ
ncbi:MAG: hypothetical protein CVT63_06250 [Candidatus Anoxymicrobium japonicum]|uniref:Leucine-binding protein domain-containing protein n=1 Tax=Candidatus Anoxymicrobium japonicum TaxID=2013648 RepID=A0A2N3G4Y3_9ACTN|nr:MAG: hypothetical protein CVT63_06250 [Candidatus Anoxymicrobium japonicum]